MNDKDRTVLAGIKNGAEAFTGPYGMQIGVTDYCSHQCAFCQRFSYLDTHRDDSHKSFYQIEPEKFMALVNDASRMGVEQISIVGVGEPLLHKEIFRLIAMVKKRGVRLQLTTNGALLSPQRVDDLIQSGVDILNVSVNAASQEVYEKVHGPRMGALYDKLLVNLRALASKRGERKGAPLHLSLRYVIYQTNVADLERFTHEALAIGVDEVVYQNFLPPSFAEGLALTPPEKENLAPRLRKLGALLEAASIASNASFLADLYAPEAPGEELIDFDYYRRNPCYVGWTYVMILEDGSTRPCCYCEPLGNINDHSFSHIWFGETYNLFRQRAMSLPTRSETIPGCPCFTQCGSIKENIRTAKRMGLPVSGLSGGEQAE